MINDIIQTNRLASAAGMSYGEYVAKYGVAYYKAKKTPLAVRCGGCGVRVSQKHGEKLLCNKCIKKKHSDETVQNRANYRQSYKTDGQKRTSRHGAT